MTEIEQARPATVSIARRLAWAYAAAGATLVAAAAVRTPVPGPWLARTALVLLMLAVSLRSALVWLHRRDPSQLSWWLQPSMAAETEFGATWLLYACFFAACAVVVVLV